jgi:secreted PhoX family phosphatase
MKKTVLFTLSIACSLAISAQQFDPEIPVTDWEPQTVVMPASPLQMQIIFIGNHHYVQTGPNDSTLAKQWHDFIGFTPDTDPNSQDLGWISVNHEMILADDKIGDGGGMTAFKIRRDPTTDSIIVVPQTLSDGRSGKFFNVDFTPTGETGMNCGGINGLNGRIWTAEEWFRGDISSIYQNGNGVRDTSDFTITNPDIPVALNKTVKKNENFNWMVEIDPKEAKALRKQYNWGRQPFEGGVLMPDNQTVYTGSDATPGFLTKFVATTPGDFTDGTTYVYKHDASSKWVEIDNTDWNKMLNYEDEAVAVGATMFNRLEWLALDEVTGKVYMTETGRDNPASRWIGESMAGAPHAPHHDTRATAQGTHPDSSDYWDYYGRVLELDPATDDVTVFLEGGPYLPIGDPASYPNNHLSNPDGLSFLKVGSKNYMVINEDLNGTSFGRVPAGVNNRTCELYLFDMSDPTPTVNDLKRISIVPVGAEVTGARATFDGKTLFVNSQHPSTNNPFPYNNSLTYAITGWDAAVASLYEDPNFTGNGFEIYPNPTSRELHFNKTSDVAIYDANGKRIAVYRDVDTVDVTAMSAGVYYVRNADGETQKLVIQK